MIVELNPKVFAILTALIEERTGLMYGLRDQRMFADKLLERVREAGFSSALDYYYYLRYDPASAREFDALVDALVVTETYFFRESDALRTIVDEMLRPVVEAGGRPRLWSAACASGDEPVTIAMLLDEAGILDRVDLVASDISLKALERSREQGWTLRALRAVPAGSEGRWLHREGDRVRVERRLLDAVTWRQLNLVERSEVQALGKFDVVVCRNVFIYFSDETIRAVVESIASVLRPHGRLLVGASESLLRFGTSLDCEERRGSFFYRRPT
jgi:chemotaxis protein methyltransferase CheR